MCLTQELERLCKQKGLPASTVKRLMKKMNDEVRSVRVEQMEAAKAAANKASYKRNLASVLKSAKEGDLRLRYEAVSANIDAWGDHSQT
jgi:predicted nucleotidyltransferase